MSYPWPSFGSFQFVLADGEQPIPGTDTGWQREPVLSRTSPLGSNRDVLVVMATGSDQRSFEMLLTPARFAALQLLQNSEGELVGWMRPTPDRRDAYLEGLVWTEEVRIECWDAETLGRRYRTTMTFVSR